MIKLGITIVISLLLTASISSAPSEWKISSGKVFFKSETDYETITGEGDSIQGMLDVTSKKIKIEINLGNIKTANKLQTSHMQDNYFEIDKYPISTFEGSVLDVKENGEVSALGTLQLHGIKKENITLTGKIEKTLNGLEQVSYFTISLKDYQIEVPKLVFLKVNPIIQVKVKILWVIQ